MVRNAGGVADTDDIEASMLSCREWRILDQNSRTHMRVRDCRNGIHQEPNLLPERP
jgi:hypothetical protein